jgi:hypothetical protein
MLLYFHNAYQPGVGESPRIYTDGLEVKLENFLKKVGILASKIIESN